MPGARSGYGATGKAGAVGLRVLKQGRTARRILRLRILKRSRVSGVIQRRPQGVPGGQPLEVDRASHHAARAAAISSEARPAP